MRKRQVATEREIQTTSVKTLRKMGATCLVTSNRKKTANTKGTPDVFVHMRNGMWLALEFKQPEGKTTTEQFALNQQGYSYIVDSVGAAIKVVLDLRKIYP